MMRALIFFILILLVSDCTRIDNPPVIGVKIYDHQGNLNELFDKLQSIGINTLFVSPELARKTGFMELAGRNKMPVFLIVPVFYNPEALARDTGLYAITSDGEKAESDWVRFICPNRMDYRSEHLDYMESLVRELSPDGISIDFMRYFVFWEKVYPVRDLDISETEANNSPNLPQTCFNDVCLELFCKKNKISFPDSIKTIREKAEFILTLYPNEWTAFKVNTITDYVKEITQALRKTDPALRFNLHMVPWREDDFDGAVRRITGQDAGQLAPYLDFISPMCYSQMVRRPPEWVGDVVIDMDRAAPDQVLPSIQVSRAYIEEPFPVQDFKQSLLSALEEPSRGVIFWSWETLEKNREKQEVIREVVQKIMP